MAMTVAMPQLGESVTEGTIARWLKQPGEMVAKYESIAEVVTDKVNAEIPSPAEGSMGEHIAPEGAVVAVGDAICTIETVEQGQANSAWHQGDGDAQTPAEAPVTVSEQAALEPEQPVAEQPGQPQVETQEEAAPAAQAAAPSPVAGQQGQPTGVSSPARSQPTGQPSGNGQDGGVHHLTPAVRMLLREHSVDLSQLHGSGLGGRITKKDVLEHVQQRDAGGGAGPAPSAQPQQLPQPAEPGQPASAQQQQPAAAATRPAPAPAPDAAQRSQPVAPSAPASAPQPHRAEGDQVVPMTPIRRSIAEHMVRSRQTAPHAWMTMEVDMSRVARLRAARRTEFEERYGVKLTYLPFVARAVCEGLRRHATLNASWSDEGVVLKRDIHLGIAVALENNLIVPVVRNADRLSIAGLATTMADLGERARGNRLKLDEIQGGTFTLNNTGALGTVLTSAIINQPQAAILAMDAVVERPVVVDDAIAIRPIMNLSLSFDHRINDGLQATRFVRSVKQVLESIEGSAALL